MSDIPECAEVVEEKALLFRKADVHDLQDKLQGLCDDEKTVTAYKSEAADFICGKYNWEYVVERTLRTYGGR